MTSDPVVRVSDMSDLDIYQEMRKITDRPPIPRPPSAYEHQQSVSSPVKQELDLDESCVPNSDQPDRNSHNVVEIVVTEFGS